MLSLRSSRSAFAALNGLSCVYKPSGISAMQMIDVIKGNLERDLNAFDFVSDCHSPALDLPVETKTPTVMTPAIKRLVLGKRYIKDDVDVALLHNMGRHASGLAVVGINRGCSWLQSVRDAKLLRIYHVSGKLGIATHNYSEHGRIIEKIAFGHVSHSKMDRICSAIQAVHLKEQYRYAGVDLQSQEAYDLAAAGAIRPASDIKTPLLVYGIKCVAFDPPAFTLEVSCINESTIALMELAHNLGIQLKSAAVCTAVRCTRYGPLTVTDTLSRHQWNYNDLLRSMSTCHELLASCLTLPPLLRHQSAGRRVG